MEIASKYSPEAIEEKWYAYWLENNLFESKVDSRTPYTIVIPPPNVTGILHMGHMLNNTLQDVLIRRARMQGLNACWVPGTDHASIATEAKVTQKLAKAGINKFEIGREKFLDEAWKWKEEHGNIILKQLQKLGASCDWSREKFTMEESLSESVIKVFIDLHQKGLIYRGYRMVNWDPEALTAVSDEEVIHKEVDSNLYYVKYAIENSSEFITIATTRPETIMGDSGICVHPNDERYKHLIGKKAIVPLVNRVVPIVADEYIQMEFGTGCLKVTPAHDINDYEIGKKHNLEIIDCFNPNGTLGEKAQIFVGEDRFVVRKKMKKALEEHGDLVKIEAYKNKVGYSERSNAVIEPRLSEQWFLKMDAFNAKSLEAVMSDEVAFFPKKFKNTYKHWLENIQDWCISRQLWWGHRIPAFYYGNASSDYVVAENMTEALQKIKEKGIEINPENVFQDNDVLDTWFSSWLWPISVFDGIRNPKNPEIEYYYPTNTLVTGHDIIFFWVARMIMAGLEYRNEKPFENVYFTGMVRDKLGRKMSKQLGNSPDALGLIKEFGADGVRIGMMLTAPAGNDLLYDDSLCLQGRNFANKLWNAFRLVKGWEIDENAEIPKASKQAISWIEQRMSLSISEIDEKFEQFRISEALMVAYKLTWNDFCSWYLEIIKPAFGEKIDSGTLKTTLDIFDKLLRILHPFAPFITEEIWQHLKKRKKGESICVAAVPKKENTDTEFLKNFDFAIEMVSGVRACRKENNIPFKDVLELQVILNENDSSNLFPVVQKLGNLSAIQISDEKPQGALSFLVDKTECFIFIDGGIDVSDQIEKIKAEIDYLNGFIVSVNKKLSNEKFVSGAPEAVVDKEKKKRSDAEEKINMLTAQLSQLS